MGHFQVKSRLTQLGRAGNLSNTHRVFKFGSGITISVIMIFEIRCHIKCIVAFIHDMLVRWDDNLCIHYKGVAHITRRVNIWTPNQRRSSQGIKNIGRRTQQQNGGKSWRDRVSAGNALTSRRAFTRKLIWLDTTIVITRTILKLNSWDFLMAYTIVLLKLLMSCNNSQMVTVLSLWRSKDRKKSLRY